MDLKETTLSSQTPYNGCIVSVRLDQVTLPDGKLALREVVEHPGGVCILPVDEDSNVYLVRQFRYPFGEALLEIPAGKLERGENPLHCGIRELKEEVGCTATQMTFLGNMFSSPGFTDENVWIYLATGLTFGKNQPDEDEWLEVEKMPLKQLVTLVIEGKVPDAKTQLAALKAHLFFQNGAIPV